MNTVTVSVAEAGRNLSRLVRAAEEGFEVVITRRGGAAARLTAIGPTTPGTGNGRRAAAVLAGRLQARRRWADPATAEATIAHASDGWKA
jgi:prevent-host-death family protein